jgi:hypothetical protein
VLVQFRQQELKRKMFIVVFLLILHNKVSAVIYFGGKLRILAMNLGKEQNGLAWLAFL